MIGVIGTENREVGFFDILNAGSYELKRIERPSVGVGRRVSVSSYRHNVVLVIYVIMFELDRIWIDDVFLIDDYPLAILVVVREADGIVEFVAVGDYGVWMHGGERG